MGICHWGLWDVYVFCKSVGADLQTRLRFRRHNSLGEGRARLALLESSWEAFGDWLAFEKQLEGIRGFPNPKSVTQDQTVGPQTVGPQSVDYQIRNRLLRIRL